MKYLVLCVALLIPSFCLADIPQHLQDVSVTIKTERGEGSGVLITREVEIKGKKEKVNFVWTAAHVVANLRSTRTAIINGEVKQVVEFKDAQIVKELVENGRRVGELKMDAKIIKYSDADLGEDLALLMVRKLSFVDKNTEFVDSDEPLSIGTRLYHVGSLLGQTGSNSMTTGIVSQIGRVLQLGNSDGTVFDQSTVTAFPGSSGGGVFLTEDAKENSGRYMGMLVRGGGETFNLLVPVRRMREWAAKEKILWALKTSEAMPKYEDLIKGSIEASSLDNVKKTSDSKEFDFLIRDMRARPNPTDD